MPSIEERLAARQRQATEAAQAVARPQDPPAGVPAADFRPAETGVVIGQVVPAPRIPDPQDPETDGDTLTDAEQQRLAAYEATLDRHREAFWEEGKCLAGIIKGKLHRGRDGYPSVEAYLDDRWGISRTAAYRRMELWQLGERLSPMGDTFNERQARALKSYADKYGLDAAETVYRTIVETDGVKVTAKLVEGAVGVLPAGKYNETKTVERVRAFLAGKVKPAIAAPGPVDQGERVEQVRARIRRLVSPKLIRSVPASARKELAAELYALAKQLENES